MFGFPTAKKGPLGRGFLTFWDGSVNPMLEVESVQVKGGPPTTPILMAAPIGDCVIVAIGGVDI